MYNIDNLYLAIKQFVSYILCNVNKNIIRNKNSKKYQYNNYENDLENDDNELYFYDELYYLRHSID